MRLQEPGAGLFFTSLVRIQTNVDSQPGGLTDTRTHGVRSDAFERFAREQTFRPVPCSSVEQRFRHSGWQLERLRVLHALSAAHVPRSRFERFEACGADCVVEWSPSRERYRLRANYCGDRFCLPCARARSVRVRNRILSLVGDRTPLVITFTIANKRQSLTAAIDHLNRSFRKLRQQKIWLHAVDGGAAFIEVKKGAGSGEWHPHLHVLAVGRFIPKEKLRDAWLKATGDSFIVDIQRARTPGDAGHYATKYATKGWTPEVSRDHDALVECVLSLRARRLCLTFGEWHGVDLEDENSGAEDWRRVERIDRVYAGFLNNEAWAVAVWRAINAGIEEKLVLPPAPE